MHIDFYDDIRKKRKSDPAFQQAFDNIVDHVLYTNPHDCDDQYSDFYIKHILGYKNTMIVYQIDEANCKVFVHGMGNYKECIIMLSSSLTGLE